MMTYQITPTLLNSFDLYLRAPSVHKVRYAKDLEATLKRTHRDMPAYVQKGVVFEREVQAYVQNECAGGRRANVNVNASYGVREVGETILSTGEGNFRWQKWVPPFSYTMNGVHYKFIGKTDVERDKSIIDIKTTTKPREPAYYLSGWQGPLYCLATKKPTLTYVVAEWSSPDDPEDMGVEHVFSCTYTLKNSVEVITDLQVASARFMGWVVSQGLLEDYTYTYSRNARV